MGLVRLGFRTDFLDHLGCCRWLSFLHFSLFDFLGIVRCIENFGLHDVCNLSVMVLACTELDWFTKLLHQIFLADFLETHSEEHCLELNWSASTGMGSPSLAYIARYFHCCSNFYCIFGSEHQLTTTLILLQLLSHSFQSSNRLLIMDSPREWPWQAMCTQIVILLQHPNWYFRSLLSLHVQLAIKLH